ncbi:MAG: hypothetical protein Q9204_006178 [Flavoplaca sp. TL-2023a]
MVSCSIGVISQSLHDNKALPSPTIDSGGCLISFTGPNNDIPVQTSGSTTLPPYSSGGPSQTVPCAKILAYLLDQAKSRSGIPSGALPTASSSAPGISAEELSATVPPTITSPASMLTSRTSRKTLSYCRPNVTTVNYEMFCRNWRLDCKAVSSLGLAILSSQANRPGLLLLERSIYPKQITALLERMRTL